MLDTNCKECGALTDEEHIYCIKGRGWVCETCLEAESPYPYNWSEEEL